MNRVPPSLLLALAALCAALTVASSSVTGICIGGAALAISLVLCRGSISSAIAFVAAYIFVGIWAWHLAPPPADDTSTRTRTAVVEEARTGTSGTRAIVTVPQDGGAPLHVSLVVTDIVPTLAPGDIITFRSRLRPAGHLSDIPGMRMAAMTERSQRISASAVVHSDGVTVCGKSDDIRFVPGRLRSAIADAVYASQLSPGASALLVASALGTGDTPPETREAFRATGLSHLLCVSGFHVGVIAAVIGAMLWPLSVAGMRRTRFALTIAAVWVYAFVTGLTPSVIRASVMVTVFLVSKMSNRGYSPAGALFFAFFVVLAIDPYKFFSAGFQLSFGAVAGILVFAGAVGRMTAGHRMARRLLLPFAVPAAAFTGTLPVMLAWFHTVSLSSVPVNAVAVMLFPVFMCAGLGAVITGNSLLADAVNIFHTYASAALDTAASASPALVSTPGTLSLLSLTAAIAALGIVAKAADKRLRLYSAGAAAVCLLATGCEPLQRGEAVIIDGDSRGTDIHIVSQAEAVSYIGAASGRAVTDFTPFFALYGSTPARLPRPGRVHSPAGSIAFAGKAMPEGHADIVVVTGRFRGDTDVLLDSTRAACVIIGADIDDSRCADIEAAARRRSVATHRLALRPFCRIIQNE
ncbi:MAG: ComEC/Rec2 family competence protein [Muribaculaceae bacterium]|nr:ComEC/Rec2 family competence protein [Muribaculaceae bacterium]